MEHKGKDVSSNPGDKKFSVLIDLSSSLAIADDLYRNSIIIDLNIVCLHYNNGRI